MQQVQPVIDEVGPTDAYQILCDDADAALIDVRTRAEWAFVGQPDLGEIGREVWSVEWTSFPAMSRNPAFLDEVIARADAGKSSKLLFICRSGARSMAAAQATAAALATTGRQLPCINVAEGFEGDLDGEGHRSGINGWKRRGLPWRQG